MKYSLIFIVILFSLCLLSAQDLQPWQFVRHSARDNNGMVHIRFNGSPSILGTYELFSFQNSVWQSFPLDNPEALTYEALLPYTYGQNLKYRLRTSYEAAGQSITAMNPAFLDSDTFPPGTDYLGYIADDPVGDSISAYYANLDLTGNWFGYTDTKLFTKMANAANSFPTMNSLSSYNIYFAGLANSATALTDSSVYAMLYTFNVPTIISSGLYKFNFNMADTSFVYTRLGDIQSQVVNGKLNLACNIGDLTADQNFGTWPPAGNSLGFMAGSLRLDMDFSTMTPTFTIGDFSGIAQLIFENFHYQVAQNALPEIYDWHIIETGNMKTLDFYYSDANQDFPLVAMVVLDDSSQIEILPLFNSDFSQPIIMNAELPFSGWDTAQIRVSDNMINYVNCSIYNVTNEDETLPSVTVCKVYPNPFNPDNALLTVSLTGNDKSGSKGVVYNLKGQLVRKLAGVRKETETILQWDGCNDSGKIVAEGIYLLRIGQGLRIISKKIVLTR